MKKPKRPYSSTGDCPQCGNGSIVPVNDADELLIGVKCKCGFKATLRPFPLEGALGYFIGDDGRAWSIQRGLRALPTKLNRGFPRVKLSIDSREYYPYLAPAVLTAFNGPRPAGKDAVHEDGDVQNCAFHNLSWGVVRNRQVDAEKFVAVWQSCDTPRQVCDRLGMEYGSVIGRAVRMREHGVPLKSMSRSGTSGNSLDWESLAEIARKFEEKNGQD